MTLFNVLIQRKHRKTKNQLSKRTRGKNADLHKAVLKKTITKQQQCVKYDFVAPLNFFQSWDKMLYLVGGDYGKIVHISMHGCLYSRVPNNRRGWNNRGGGAVDGVEKIGQAVSQYLYLKLNTTLFSFFSTNGHIFPTQFNTTKLRNDGI